eukprot:520881-Rhodomonas_salina.2
MRKSPAGVSVRATPPPPSSPMIQTDPNRRSSPFSCLTPGFLSLKIIHSSPLVFSLLKIKRAALRQTRHDPRVACALRTKCGFSQDTSAIFKVCGHGHGHGHGHGLRFAHGLCFRPRLQLNLYLESANSKLRLTRARSHVPTHTCPLTRAAAVRARLQTEPRRCCLPSPGLQRTGAEPAIS